MWIQDSSCEEVVKHSWTLLVRGSPAFRVCKRIKEVKKALRDWNKSNFGILQEKN